MLIHVMNGPKLRGAERFGVELAEELAERGVRQRIIFLSGLDSQAPQIVDCDIETCDQDLRGIGQLRWLRGQLLNEPGAVVLCHGQGPQKASVIALLGTGSRRPFLAVKQIGMLMHWVRRFVRLRLLLNRMLMARTDLCICLGPKQAEELLKQFAVPAAKIVRIPNGRRLPTKLPDGIVRAKQEILMVGALSLEKNPALALDLLEELRRSLRDCKLTFVGDGPLRGMLARRAAQEFPEGAVRFRGHLADIWPHYLGASVLLLCSDTEGVPGVVIEATLAGLPTVAWEVGDIAEVLQDGRNGLLVPFGDRVALRQVLQTLLGADAVLANLQAHTVGMAAELTFDRIADSYLECLHLKRTMPEPLE